MRVRVLARSPHEILAVAGSMIARGGVGAAAVRSFPTLTQVARTSCGEHCATYTVTMISSDELGTSLVSTINDKGAADVLADAAEAALDDLMTDGVLKNVPIVGSLIKVAKAGFGISDYIFLKKVARFLYELRDVPEADRHEFIGLMQTDADHKRKVGEALVLLLDRMDDMSKPGLLARAFKAYLQGRITYDTFRRIGFAIDTLFLGFLELIADPRRLSDMPQDVQWNLASSGILTPSGMPANRSGVNFPSYSLTEFGTVFRDIVLLGR